MSVRDSLIIDWVRGGATVNEVVQQLQGRGIPTAKKTVAKVLKGRGFVYDKQLHSWHEGADNRNLIEVNVNEGLPIQEVPKRELQPLQPNAIELLNVIGLSPEQFNVLREVANERLAGNDEPTNINAAVAQLRARDRGNKTFYISKALAEDAATFAERQGIKLSHLIEIALIETMQKYKK